MTLEEMQNLVREALESESHDNLLAQGQARAMIWRDGKLPDDSPNFKFSLSYDLLSYGCSLLLLGIRLREGGCEDPKLIRDTFRRAGEAIESVVSKGDSADLQRGFYRLLSATAFHLAGYSAQAFSLLHHLVKDINLLPMERALARLILRDLDGLEKEFIRRRMVDKSTDKIILKQLEQIFEPEATPDPIAIDDTIAQTLDIALSDQFYGALGAFLLALQSGDKELVKIAHRELAKGLDAAASFNLVPQWWCFRLTLHLLDDLWDASFHAMLPEDLPEDSPERENTEWQKLRRLFIALLFCRDRAEIELWPSQTKAAGRSVDIKDNLVVSLPTSAGKTRIAELCILRCLAMGKRVVFVTPLRALSAQTEVTLRRTFSSLGLTVSALYGSSGASSFDINAIGTHHIVVATPEKLDFALRNDASLLDTVGLVVLDEGHMIGLNEREIRYEVQIQNLLRRDDAATRRIVCLSAVLPGNEQLNDFVQWIRRDEQGEAINLKWRPTRLRFGEVLWQGNHARLNLRVEDERPFVPRFFEQRQPTQRGRRTPFPKDNGEFSIGTAWRLVKDEQSVLIFCPERRLVESLAKKIIDLTNRGFLSPILKEGSAELLETALTIGKEWLGEEHPILKCLSLGVGVHHGKLPISFRKEIESLIQAGILKITICSPTLAQGLNLATTAIVMHALTRAGEPIPLSEFNNVIGRAGRAFIDVEGLVLLPVFKKENETREERGARNRKLNLWENFTQQTNDMNLKSGLVQLISALLDRLRATLGNEDLGELQEYILNNEEAWNFTALEGENTRTQAVENKKWDDHITFLDTAVLGLVGNEDVDVLQVADKLDEVLQSSLWQKCLQREEENVEELLAIIKTRTKFIWGQTTSAQRKGYFLAGVGLQTGQQLDRRAADLNKLLFLANGAILVGNKSRAIAAIILLGKILFSIRPFTPYTQPPNNWRKIMQYWLLGQPLADVGDNSSEIADFVEDGLVYRLSWGLEAIKARAKANGDTCGDGRLTIDEVELGLAVPAIETGTLNRSAAVLIQAGFSHRLAAIKAVRDTSASFEDSQQLKTWLGTDDIKERGKDETWPTPESHGAWLDFIENYELPEKSVWRIHEMHFEAEWIETAPAPNTTVKLISQGDKTFILSATLIKIGHLKQLIIIPTKGLLTAKVAPDRHITTIYYGPPAS